jgi:NADPH:quinone reductase-like Zn-dependent oxidoreductase
MLGVIGAAAEYVVTPANLLCRKPAGLSHTQAASLPTVAITALQSFEQAPIPSGLSGKTVLVPAALSGTGHIALQLAKHVFGASRVITTASPSKISRLPELLGEGTVDEVIDYTTGDVVKQIEKGIVDFLFDTMGVSLPYLPLLKKGTGTVVSISTLPSGSQAKEAFPETPWMVAKVMDLLDCWRRWRAHRWGVTYRYFAPNPELFAKDLGRFVGWVLEGKVIPVIGRTAKLTDLEGVKVGCQEVLSGKGGVGKFVIEVI